MSSNPVKSTTERVEKGRCVIQEGTAVTAKRVDDRNGRGGGVTFEGRREAKGLVRFRCTKSNYGMVSGNHI